MKRLLALTAVAVLIATSTGCRLCNNNGQRGFLARHFHPNEETATVMSAAPHCDPCQSGFASGGMGGPVGFGGEEFIIP